MKDWTEEILGVPYPTILGIIVAAVLVFAFESASERSVVMEYGLVPADFIAGWAELADGRFHDEAFRSSSRLFTALFLHGGPEHLLFNMVFLWTFGSLTAQFLGNWWALALFFLCGACGNLLQIYLDPESMATIIGASGAICGFGGIYLGLALQWELPWPEVWPLARPIPPMQLGAFALIGFVFDVYSLSSGASMVAYGAHIGGLLSGLAMAILITRLYPTRTSYDPPGRRR